jgi:hypothetical protein
MAQRLIFIVLSCGGSHFTLIEDLSLPPAVPQTSFTIHSLA